jgi:hypothetical protein
MARRRRVLIPGPVLIGFAELFDRAHGDPRTERPYARVTPSCVGSSLLPFPCPYCGAVRPELVDRKKWVNYHDRERGFSWCPSCLKRFVIDYKGTPLKKSLPAGAIAAPALVERDGKTTVVGLLATDGLDALGAE